MTTLLVVMVLLILSILSSIAYVLEVVSRALTAHRPINKEI